MIYPPGHIMQMSTQLGPILARFGGGAHERRDSFRTVACLRRNTRHFCARKSANLPALSSSSGCCFCTLSFYGTTITQQRNTACHHLKKKQKKTIPAGIPASHVQEDARSAFSLCSQCKRLCHKRSLITALQC